MSRVRSATVLMAPQELCYPKSDRMRSKVEGVFFELSLTLVTEGFFYDIILFLIKMKERIICYEESSIR